MGVEDVELFQLEVAVRSLLPLGVLQEKDATTSSCAANTSNINSNSSNVNGSSVQQPELQDSGKEKAGSINLTAVAVTASCQ
jgi:hypothetical protein